MCFLVAGLTWSCFVDMLVVSVRASGSDFRLWSDCHGSIG